MKRAVNLGVLLVLVMLVGNSTRTNAADGPKLIEITAKRFGFTPDNVTLKKGEPVTLKVTSQDVTHGLFVRALRVDELIEPGKTVEIKVVPDKEGTFTAICHHFCGAGHGNMKMTFTVVP